jgi:predicted negative regulator of RcsB-dependent stress response
MHSLIASSFLGGPALWPILLTVATVLAVGWAVTRAQAVSAWRSAAEGYKEQVADLTQRLERAEHEVEGLHETVTTLEQRPDMSAALDAIESRSAQNAAAVIQAVRDMLAPLSSSLADLRRTLDPGRR